MNELVQAALSKPPFPPIIFSDAETESFLSSMKFLSLAAIFRMLAFVQLAAAVSDASGLCTIVPQVDSVCLYEEAQDMLQNSSKVSVESIEQAR